MSYSIEDELRILQLLFRNEQAYRTLLEQTGAEAQSSLDWLQQLIDAPGISTSLRASICQTMVRLSKNSGLCPSCLTIGGVTRLGEHPVDGGGFGDIWKGQLEGVDDQLVCLKVVKVYLMKDMQRLLKEYLREAIIWRQLKHPNILPCLGLYYLDDTHERICLVSPWIENGNLSEFLKGRPRESVDHLQLMYDIAKGLSYLHAFKIIHGDLKSVNILITSSQRACIADFGLSSVADSQIFRVTSTIAHAGGTARWCAPELHSGESATKKSDIYSCGCLFYEIITGLPPFNELKRDPAIVFAVLRGERPAKPQGNKIPDDLWSLVSSCWESNPSLRPTAEDILQRLLLVSNTLPAEDWNDKLFIELRWNVISRLTWVDHQCRVVLDMLTAAEIMEEPGANTPLSILHSQRYVNVQESDGDYGSSAALTNNGDGNELKDSLHSRVSLISPDHHVGSDHSHSPQLTTEDPTSPSHRSTTEPYGNVLVSARPMTPLSLVQHHSPHSTATPPADPCLQENLPILPSSLMAGEERAIASVFSRDIHQTYPPAYPLANNRRERRQSICPYTLPCPRMNCHERFSRNFELEAHLKRHALTFEEG